MSGWAAFFSYAHHDDDADGGRLRELAKKLAAEVQSQTGQPFEIFVDRKDVHWGENWKRALNEGLQRSTFLIPVITPSYFRSEYCQEELATFLRKEERLSRDDLVFPVYYIEVGLFDDESLRSDNKLASALHERQYVDWRGLRRGSLSTVRVSTAIDGMANRLHGAITKSAGPSAQTPKTGAGERGERIGASVEQTEVVDFVLLLAACVVVGLDARLVLSTLGENRRCWQLAHEHHPRLVREGRELAGNLDAVRPGLGEQIRTFVTEDFSKFIKVTDLYLRSVEGSASWLLDNEDFQAERKLVWYTCSDEWQRLQDELESHPVFEMPLADQGIRRDYWAVLGFETESEFVEYLQPTMRTLTGSPGELDEHILERLLDGPLNRRDLEAEGLPARITTDLLNRLLVSSWATVEGDVVSLTPSGKSLLSKRLEDWRARSG